MGQWRYSIGMFNAKSVHRNFRKDEENFNPMQLLFNLLCLFLGSMPVEILIGLLQAFAYCSMIISLLPLFLFLCPFFKLCMYFQRLPPFPKYTSFIFLFIFLRGSSLKKRKTSCSFFM